ncbi:MAG TPA: aminopeptidase [Hyphomicrobiales bacterium]|nr:aminopeptidase [Hyphomicrobiales bacterium]
MVLCWALFLAGCESVGYYSQAMRGHLGLMRQRQPIATLLGDAQLDPQLRERLQRLETLRDFAARELSLPVEHHYQDLVMLDSPYVVWNVFASPEFSLTPKQWCYPVAGCASYRGYFEEAAANRYADTLRRQGYDVYVGGVSAYSTLGWFADPLPATLLQREPWQLASLLFHELAHQVAYAPGDTEFNESFATAVEQEGLRRWMGQLEGSERTTLLLASAQERARRDDFVNLVQGVVSALHELYASELPPEAMRERKQQLIEQLRADYQDLKRAWEGRAGYDTWFSQDLNNAQLGTVATYHGLVPAFEELLKRHGGNLPAFYEEVVALSKLPAATRQQRLQALLPP